MQLIAAYSVSSPLVSTLPWAPNPYIQTALLSLPIEDIAVGDVLGVSGTLGASNNIPGVAPYLKPSLLLATQVLIADNPLATKCDGVHCWAITPPQSTNITADIHHGEISTNNAAFKCKKAIPAAYAILVSWVGGEHPPPGSWADVDMSHNMLSVAKFR